MLSQREIKLIELLKNKSSEFISTTELANDLNVSVRTVQNELRDLKLLKESSFTILSDNKKGHTLVINDLSSFESLLEESIVSDYSSFDTLDKRVTYILDKFLFSESHIKYDELEVELFCSQSTLNNAMIACEQILNGYDIQINHTPHYGSKIHGDEVNIRSCILNEIIIPQSFIPKYNKENIFNQIKDTVTSTLINYKYHIDDVTLQNLLMFVYVSIKRNLNSNYIELDSSNLSKIAYSHHDYGLAYEIHKELSEKFNVKFIEDEIIYLSIFLFGNKKLTSSNIISPEISSDIDNIFSLIKKRYSLDFTNDLDLRIALSLHYIPMMIRLRTNMQIKNPLKTEIKSNYPFAYELANIFRYFVQQKYELRMSSSEMSYFAIHFHLALEKKSITNENQSILVITSGRTSDSLLLKHTLFQWFEDSLKYIDVINILEIDDINLNDFDIILSTVANDNRIPKRAKEIDYFLTLNDRDKINRLINGHKHKNYIINYFDEDLFINNLKSSTIEETIETMTNTVDSKYTFDTDLFESVLERESHGTTAYGNLIALPHPNNLISKSTFVSTAILDKPIKWGDDLVQLVFLICVQKDGEDDLRDLYALLSKLLKDFDSVQSIVNDNTYDNLIRILK